METVNKPANIEKHDLIAFIGLYDKPVTSNTFPLVYQRNDLAVNYSENKLQIYVTAETKAGLKKFKTDYPNAEIRKDSDIDNPEEWEQLAYPNELPDDTSTLDNYFHARAREHKQLKETEILKEKQ